MGDIEENIGERVCKEESFSKLLVEFKAAQATQIRKRIKL
jgi:hypothetical protein